MLEIGIKWPELYRKVMFAILPHVGYGGGVNLKKNIFARMKGNVHICTENAYLFGVQVGMGRIHLKQIFFLGTEWYIQNYMEKFAIPILIGCRWGWTGQFTKISYKITYFWSI